MLELFALMVNINGVRRWVIEPTKIQQEHMMQAQNKVVWVARQMVHG